jgi:hypothetical protein
VRLQTEELEQAVDAALGNPGFFGDGANAPMCGGLGLARECLGDQLCHGLILDRARPARTHLVVEPLDPIGDEAIAPFADRMRADAKPASTIFARNVSAAGSERDRVMAERWARSSLDIVSIAFGRPVRIGYLLRSGYPKPMQ